MNKTKNAEGLKPGWRSVKFGDVVQLSKARCADPLAEGVERYVGLEHLEPGDLRIRNWGNVADGVTFTSVFQPGQVLFGKRRAYQRKVAVADFSGVCSGDIYVMETKDAQVLMPELLPFICQTDAFFEHAVGTSAGSLSPRTNWTSLASYDLLLPPPDVQATLVEMFSAIRDCIDLQRESIKSAISLEQAFLKNVLANQQWDERQLNEVCELIVDCKNRTPPYVASGYPVVRTTNVRGGRLAMDGILFTDEIGFTKWTERALPQEGDLLFTREAPVGEVCLLPADISACLGQRMMLFRADPKLLNPQFFLLAMLSTQIRQQLVRLAGGSTVGHVRVDDAKSLRIRVPSLDIQQNCAFVFFEIRNALDSAERNLMNTQDLLRRALCEGLCV